MGKIKKIALLFLIINVLCGCREEFDSHYNDIGSGTMGKNIAQVLKEREDTKLFLALIQRAKLERTLSESGLYTCFAPKDTHVQQWLDKNGWTVESIPMRSLVAYINYHFISGMKYYYDFEKKYEPYTFSDPKHEPLFMFFPYYMTRGSNKIDPKAARIYTASYLNNKADDYKAIYGVEPTDFMFESSPVSEVDRDIPTSNGVLHVLDNSQGMALRVDEVLEADSECSIFMDMMNRFVGYESIGMDDEGIIDTTLIKFYNVSLSPNSKVLDIADDKLSYTLWVPTNAAMDKYFQPYLNEEMLVSYEEMPDQMVIRVLKSLINIAEEVIWGISDIERQMPYFTMSNGSLVSTENNLSAILQKGTYGSNGIIYKVNEMPIMPLMSSVEMGLYIYGERYGEWNRMIENNHFSVNFLGTDNVGYQHIPTTVLIQSNESPAWENPGKDWGMDGYESEYLDTLGMRMAVGVLNEHVEDGAFEERFYTGKNGHLLYDAASNSFSDYKGNQVRLISKEPTWKAERGAFYEVDGFFEHLLTSDSTQLLYRKAIEEDPELATFKLLIEKAEAQDLLDKVGYTAYTILAPTNEAFEDSETNLKAIEQMEQEDAEEVLHRHILVGRRIFTDGQSKGVFSTMSNLQVTLSGSWEDFRVTSQYSKVSFDIEKSNIQCSNGVLHKAKSVLGL